jgi:hypothetical protein
MIASDDPSDWPEADTLDEIRRRRPMLAALADLCDAYAEAHPDELAAVAHWAEEASDS